MDSQWDDSNADFNDRAIRVAWYVCFTDRVCSLHEEHYAVFLREKLCDRYEHTDVYFCSAYSYVGCFGAEA